jgi:hypothetical protein
MRHASILLALIATGCGLTPVDITVAFPSRNTFLYSDFGRLLVYDVTPDEEGLGSCPQLVDEAISETFGTPALDSDWQPICDFRAAAVRFDDVPPGPHAYVMISRDQSNVVLLGGCTIAEAYEDAPPIEVALYPTDLYNDATEDRVLTCTTEEQKCGGGC